MDPTLLAVLSIFGGAALTAGAGFVGTRVQSRREHDRWLREQRHEVCRDYLHALDNYRALFRANRLDDTNEGQAAPLQELIKFISYLDLLGPDKLAESARQYALIQDDHFKDLLDSQSVERARESFIAEARKQLLPFGR